MTVVTFPVLHKVQWVMLIGMSRNIQEDRIQSSVKSGKQELLSYDLPRRPGLK